MGVRDFGEMVIGRFGLLSKVKNDNFRFIIMMRDNIYFIEVFVLGNLVSMSGCRDFENVIYY